MTSRTVQQPSCRVSVRASRSLAPDGMSRRRLIRVISVGLVALRGPAWCGRGAWRTFRLTRNRAAEGRLVTVAPSVAQSLVRRAELVPGGPAAGTPPADFARIR